MKKILIQLIMCIMLWTVIEAQFTESVADVSRQYLLQNSEGHLKHLPGRILDSNQTGGEMDVILVIGDKVEEYDGGFWLNKRYRKVN